MRWKFRQQKYLLSLFILPLRAAPFPSARNEQVVESGKVFESIVALDDKTPAPFLFILLLQDKVENIEC